MLAKSSAPTASCFHPDYPHERVYGEFLKDIPELLKRPELSDDAKQKILYDNAKEFYRI